MEDLPKMFWQPYTDKVRLIQPDNLVRLFHLDERTGTSAKDYSPYARIGTYSGVTLQDDIQPCGLNATEFGGAGEVDILSNLNTDWPVGNKTQGTIMQWLQKDDWSTTSKQTSLALWTNASNQIEFWTLGGGGTFYLWGRWSGLQRYIACPVSGTGWHCFIFTWDTTIGVGDYVEGWKDGISQGTETDAGGNFTGSLNQAYIGDTQSNPSNPWDGKIGITAIWDTVLSDDEIKQVSRV